MDTAIKNGDFFVDEMGLPVQVSGQEELLQRAWLRLQVPKGAFCYQKKFGSRLAELDPQSSDITAKAFDAATEALAELPQVTVRGVSVEETEGQTVFLFQLATRCGEGTVEVSFPGKAGA